MDERPAYVLTGGGTGGHLFPGIAVAEEILARQPQAQIRFVGTDRNIERQILREAGFEHFTVPMPPSSALLRRPVRSATDVWRSLRAAGRWIEEWQPLAVIGLGGYASVPMILRARKRGIPTVLLEQNAVAGSATRWLSRRASLVCLTFRESSEQISRQTTRIVTGNPVRREIVRLSERAHAEPDGDRKPVLLILGGSQGARAVNEAMLNVLDQLSSALSGWMIVHQCGSADAEAVARWYADREFEHLVAPFLADLPEWYSRATLAVSRAGATTLAELACCGCPAILVPYPNSAGNHQRLNAKVFEEAGAAVTVEQAAESAGTAERLASRLIELVTNAERRRSLRERMAEAGVPDAASQIVDHLEELVRRQRRPDSNR